MKKLLKKIEASMEIFYTEAMLQIDNNNKTAGTQARKKALEIEELMQEFQLMSLKNNKTAIPTTEHS